MCLPGTLTLIIPSSWITQPQCNKILFKSVITNLFSLLLFKQFGILQTVTEKLLFCLGMLAIWNCHKKVTIGITYEFLKNIPSLVPSEAKILGLVPRVIYLSEIISRACQPWKYIISRCLSAHKVSRWSVLACYDIDKCGYRDRALSYMFNKIMANVISNSCDWQVQIMLSACPQYTIRHSRLSARQWRS